MRHSEIPIMRQTTRFTRCKEGMKFIERRKPSFNGR